MGALLTQGSSDLVFLNLLCIMKYKKKVCVYPFIPSSLASHKVVIVGVIASPKLRRDQYKDKDFLKKPIMITYLGCTDFDQIWHGDQVEAGQAFY